MKNINDSRLEELSKVLQKKGGESKPVFFDLKKQKDVEALLVLSREHKIYRVSDDYTEQLREYFHILHPNIEDSNELAQSFGIFKEEICKNIPLWQHGVWVFFPWSGSLSHILIEDAFQKVRTARNRDLITEKEQEKFYQSSIGIAGLSVGNSIILTVVLMGGAKHVKLADNDRLALSNTNRVRAGLHYLGSMKTEITAQQIYELNPYAIVETYPEGLTPVNIEHFFNGLNAVIDEIDSVPMKYLIRKYARKKQLPVLMAADEGDSAIIDIERHDIDKKTEFFHGAIKDLSYKELSALNKKDVGKVIVRILGPQNIPLPMQESLLKIGKTLVSWPQLGGTATLNGAAISYCLRRILCGQKLPSGKSVFSFDEQLIPEFNSISEKKKRTEATKKFKSEIGL